MKDFQQFTHKQIRQKRGLKIPQTFVRPVSLEKIRENSRAKAKQTQEQLLKQKQNQAPKSKVTNNQIYEKMLEKKLLAKQEAPIIYTDKQSKIKFLKLQQRSEVMNIRQQKKVEKKKEYEQSKFKQCTFKPKILNQSDNRRTLKQFLDFQKAHCQRKEQKIDHLKEEIKKNIQQTLTFQPQISKNTYINNSQQYENVYQRLFEQAKLKNQKSQYQKQNLNDQTIHKTSPIQKSIVTHSMQRISNNELKKAPSHRTFSRNITERSQNQSMKKDKSQLSTTPKSSSSNNQKFIINKVLKQILKNCSILNINYNMINYLQFGDLMTLMRFVRPQNTNVYNERKCLFELWSLFKCEDNNQYIEIHNVSKIILSIIGIHNIKLIEKIINQSEQYHLLKISEQRRDSSYTQIKNTIIDEKQSKRLKKTYQILNTIRLNTDTRKNITQSLPSFQPQILNSSRDLAEKFRNKILEQTSELLKNKQIIYNIPENGQINHIDLLLLQEKLSEAKIQRNRQEKQMIQQEKFNETCHKPVASINSLRYLELYAMSNKNQKRDRTLDQIELEKYKEQLTFKPNIIHRDIDKWHPVAKDVDKTLFRMFQARKGKQAQKKSNINDKKMKSIVKVKTENSQQKSPILYLNINVDNNHIEKLCIFQGDNPNQLAQQFANKFKLDNNAKIRLSKLIKSELDQVLWNIEEVDEN